MYHCSSIVREICLFLPIGRNLELFVCASGTFFVHKFLKFVCFNALLPS